MERFSPGADPPTYKEYRIRRGTRQIWRSTGLCHCDEREVEELLMNLNSEERNLVLLKAVEQYSP
ncbi:hypothetical protein [Paenibacillus terrae]|uniref:hypothetical protein n=1 Tax=Paenibacillus terrae TaxID=159743 RepID=UPI0011EB69FE|nr:hypothetical protein [Paenibacillus terrae]